MKFHLTELSRRGVFKTLAAYAVASWVLIEVASVIAPAFLLPEWTVAVLTTVVVLGAFPALVLAWRYDFTREGIKRDTSHVPDEVDRVAKRVSIVLLLLLLTVTSVLWMNYFRAQSVSELDDLLEAQQGAPEIGEDGLIQSVAVLPFDDFSPNESRKFLADGIAEAILHVLAQNKDLMVTARTSSFSFRDKDTTVAEIGRILNVQAVLEGSVQIVNEQLRVTSQLVRTSDQVHIWSNVYEAPLEDIFKVQDTIAYTVQDLILAEGAFGSNLTNEPEYPSLEAYELLVEALSFRLINTLESIEQAE